MASYCNCQDQAHFYLTGRGIFHIGCGGEIKGEEPKVSKPMTVEEFLEKWKQGWDFRNNIDSILLKGRMKADLEEMMKQNHGQGYIDCATEILRELNKGQSVYKAIGQ